MDTIFQAGLHEFLTGFIARNSRLTDAVSADYNFGCTLMRVSIRHTTHYRYDAAGSFAVQRLRLTPFDNQTQKVLSWSDRRGRHRRRRHTTSTVSATACISSPTASPTRSSPSPPRARSRPSISDGVVGNLGETANPSSSCDRRRSPQSSAAIDALSDGLPGARMLDRLHLSAGGDRRPRRLCHRCDQRGDERRGGVRGGAGGLPGPCAHLHRRRAAARQCRPAT